MDRKITFDHYKKCLENSIVAAAGDDNDDHDHANVKVVEKQSCMRSFKHTVYNITTDKKVLDPFDDKRYLKPSCHSTLAWGHKNIR